MGIVDEVDERLTTHSQASEIQPITSLPSRVVRSGRVNIFLSK